MPSPYGPSDVQVHIDNASDVLTDFSADVLNDVEEMVEGFIEEKTPINAEEPVHRGSGFKTMSDFTLQMNYTDAIRTAFLGSEGATRDFRLVTGSDQMDVDVLIVSFKKGNIVKGETTCELVLRPTGPWVYS